MMGDDRLDRAMKSETVKYRGLQTEQEVMAKTADVEEDIKKLQKRIWKPKLTWFDISIIAIFSWEKYREMGGYKVEQVAIKTNYTWHLRTEGWGISL